MNIEDSKELLLKTVLDLPNKPGEHLLVSPPLTKELVDKCPDFSQSPKLVIYLDGRYVLLHCDSADGGDFTTHRSAHSLINFIHDAVVKAWAEQV